MITARLGCLLDHPTWDYHGTSYSMHDLGYGTYGLFWDVPRTLGVLWVIILSTVKYLLGISVSRYWLSLVVNEYSRLLLFFAAGDSALLPDNEQRILDFLLERDGLLSTYLQHF